MFLYLKKAISNRLPEDHFNNKIEYGRLRDNISYLFPSAAKAWKTGVAAGVFLIVSSFLAWPQPMIMRYLIDNVLLKKNFYLIIPVISIIVFLEIMKFTVGLIQKFLSTKFTEQTILDLRQRLLKTVFSLPKSFFDKNHSGYIISRISSDINGIKFFISGTAVDLFVNTLKFIGGVIFLFYLEWRIALGVIVTLPLSFMLTRFIARRQYAISHRSSEVDANLSAAYVETVSSVQLIKSFTNETKAIHPIIEHAKSKIRIVYENMAINTLSSGFSKLMPSIAKLAVLLAGSYWVITGYWELGTLIAYLTYISYVYTPVDNLSSSIKRLESARAVLDRISSLFKIIPESNLEEGEKINRLRGNIEFRNISFEYNRNNRILNNISFKVNQGEHWAVLGKSGIGKTTLISLIMRFYIPQEGEILFDGINAEKINLKSLRQRIGYVSQNIQLISGSILDNIRYGNTGADLKTVTAAAEKAQIDDFINNLPDKYNTIIAERGINLSEGQKQRIALARVLLKEADIIILDEPTSSLDNTAENSICEILKNCLGDRTVFIIAHRPKTIKLADNIILLRENKTPLIGNRIELKNESEIREILLN